MAAEGKSIPRSNLQLVGVSAMFLVSKIEEIYAPSISDFVYITDNAYSESEIRQMELRIIRALNFDLCQPISLNFLRLDLTSPLSSLNISLTNLYLGVTPKLGRWM